MKFIKKFDSFSSAKSNELYSPMVVEIDDADKTVIAIGKLKDVDKDTPVGILNRFKTLQGFKNNIERDFERGFGDVKQMIYTTDFDESVLNSLTSSSEATCLFKTSSDYLSDGPDGEECFVYVGEYEWEGSTYYRWVAAPNTNPYFVGDKTQLNYLKYNTYSILTDTRDFSNVSVDNPYAPVGYILNDSIGEGEYRSDVIVLGTDQEDLLSLVSSIGYTRDESLKYHDASTLDANGHEYVDLGLPSGTLWATMNVGADSETGYGSYFTWGDSTIANDLPCDWNTYKFGYGNNFTKYTNSSEYSVDSAYDELLELDIEDDMVRAHMGGDWKLPTKKHFEELLDNTTFEWITNYNGTGINGRKFTSKTNSNSIFIPASGYRGPDSFSNLGNCYLWSSELQPSDSNGAYYLFFTSDYQDVDIYGRCNGLCSRGILY